jgi:hypothetical protein
VDKDELFKKIINNIEKKSMACDQELLDDWASSLGSSLSIRGIANKFLEPLGDINGESFKKIGKILDSNEFRNAYRSFPVDYCDVSHPSLFITHVCLTQLFLRLFSTWDASISFTLKDKNVSEMTMHHLKKETFASLVAHSIKIAYQTHLEDKKDNGEMIGPEGFFDEIASHFIQPNNNDDDLSKIKEEIDAFIEDLLGKQGCSFEEAEEKVREFLQKKGLKASKVKFFKKD